MISRASTLTRTSITPKEVIERATFYPVYLSSLLSNTKQITKNLGGFQSRYFESFKEALEHSSLQLEIVNLSEDPIQSRVDLKNHLDKLKITYLNMKLDKKQENEFKKIEELNKHIECVRNDIKKLITFLQYCPQVSTPQSIELTSTEWINLQIEIMAASGYYQSACGSSSDFHRARENAGEFNCAIIDLNTLIEHPTLTVLHRWTHPNRQQSSNEKKQLTEQLIQELERLNLPTATESETLKKAIKRVVSFHVCKVTMARIPVLTKIEVPYRKTRDKVTGRKTCDKVTGSRLIDQMKKIQKYSEPNSHTLYLNSEKPEIPEHEKLFSTALQDQDRIMQAIDPFFDQALWALTPTIESAKQIEISSEEDSKTIERYTQHFQRYKDIKSDIEQALDRKLPDPEGLSEIQEKFHTAINLEAQSVITTSIEQLKEAIKKTDIDETECFLSSVSELNKKLIKLKSNYQNSVDKPHFDLDQKIQHLESFKTHGKIPEIPDGGLRDYFEIYKGIQLKKEKETLKTMIDQVVTELGSIDLQIESLINTSPSPVIPKDQRCCFFWKTTNPLHTAARTLQDHVTSAKLSLIDKKVEILSPPSIEELASKKQAIADIGDTLIANIENPEITTPLQATCFESIIEKIKMVCSAICSWFTGSSPDDAHSSPKTRLSQNRDRIIQIHSNSKDTLFSRLAGHHAQETGNAKHYGYTLLPTGETHT